MFGHMGKPEMECFKQFSMAEMELNELVRCLA